MQPDDFENSTMFLSAVAALRPLSPFYRCLAQHFASVLTDQEFIERLLNADLPATAPNLTGTTQAAIRRAYVVERL
jgi:hypothetical protein